MRGINHAHMVDARRSSATDRLEQMGDAHPSEPHWYLAWLAVERGAQGHGLGDEVLARYVADVDASHLPAYLETPNPRTVPFYERHEFTWVGQAQTGLARRSHSCRAWHASPRHTRRVIAVRTRDR